jgi:phosphate transport system permease protein
MNLFFVSIILIVFLAIFLNKKLRNLRQKAKKDQRFNSLPIHFIYCFVLWSIIIAIIASFLSVAPILRNIIFASLLTVNFLFIKKLFGKNFNAKKHVEKVGQSTLAITTGIGILITIIIIVSILFEAIHFFKFVDFFDFLFGTNWNPQLATTSPEKIDESFGVIPVFLGTLLIAVIAMSVAVPLGIMGAAYLSLYAKTKTRDILKPVLEVLAGIPTVVYGYFAVTTIAPFFKSSFSVIGVDIASESALAAGFVMGIMIIPFILSLTDDALNSVPRTLKDGALAMGSTKSEMIKHVVFPAATPSIVGAIILAVSRAIGETMIVVMAAGLLAKMTFNPLESVTTATAQIVTLLVGDQEFDSPKTLAAFALALTLFVFTFIFNVIALAVIKNYKKKYS